MREHLLILGYRVRDAVTGTEGVCDSVSFDLYGCIQATVITAEKDKDNRFISHWFDAKRLVPVSDGPVMSVPRFDLPKGHENGPAYKPPR